MFFKHFECIIQCLLASIVSDGKSGVNPIETDTWWLTLLLFSRFPLILWLLIAYDMYLCISLSYSTWSLVNFWIYILMFFNKIWKVFCQYFFKYYFGPFLPLPSVVCFFFPLLFLSVPQTRQSQWSTFKFTDSFSCLHRSAVELQSWIFKILVIIFNLNFQLFQ